MTDPRGQVGVVVIGRNEGERLRRCIDSLVAAGAQVVYVDSASIDGSVEMAASKGVDVVRLDLSAPFSAARARNEGYRRLVERHPELRFVQFVDGDCEIVGDWLRHALGALREQPGLAIAAGWLRERAPEASIYNRLGDVEWNFAGAGEVDSVGGIFMVRREAFDAVGGFDATIAAGEEPELCQRLKARGWRFVRLARDMARHDLAMTRFGQWWRRMVRFGYGSTDVAVRFGLPRFRRDMLRAMFWSTWLVAVLAGAGPAAAGVMGGGAWAVWALLALWPLQVLRIALRVWSGGRPFGLALAYAFFLMLSYWPQMVGQLAWRVDRARKRGFRLIEYKAVPGAGSRRPD